ncbi:hypothetical protein SH501x_000897 [Pirellulaceae bacterium SH501]
MAAVRLSAFRLITGLTVDVLPDDKAILALRSATAIVNRMTGKYIGHVVESVTALAGEVAGTGAVLKVYGHGLPESGTVFVQRTGIAGLDAEVEFLRIDEDRIAVLGTFTISAPVLKGLLFVQKSAQTSVSGCIARVSPGPIAKIIDIRERTGERANVQFPEESILDESAYACDFENQSLTTKIEVYERVGRLLRVPGRIRPIKDRRLAELQVNYYAGFPIGIPDDMMVALSAFAKTIAQDPTGSMQSENFEDYSYSMATAEIVRQLPTSAISVIMRYRTGR